jgi:hypothetical protein
MSLSLSWPEQSATLEQKLLEINLEFRSLERLVAGNQKLLGTWDFPLVVAADSAKLADAAWQDPMAKLATTQQRRH